MSAITPIIVRVVPGYQFPTDGTVPITYDLLNRLATPTLNLQGSLGAISLGPNAVATATLQDGVLSANATGHGKMAQNFFSSDGNGLSKFAAGFWAPVAPVLGSARDLVVQTSAGAPNTTVQINATEVVLKSSAGDPFLATNVSLSAVMTTSAGVTTLGQNYLDAGVEGANRWYYLWLCNDGTTTFAMFSDAVNALPSNANAAYTYWALVGAVYNDAGSNFVPFWQHDRDAWTAEQFAVAGAGALGTGTYGAAGPGQAAWAQLSIAAFVPPNAKRARGLLSGTSTAGANQSRIAGSALGVGAIVAQGGPSGAQVFGVAISQPYEVPLTNGQYVYWQTYDTTSTIHRLSVTGWKF